MSNNPRQKWASIIFACLIAPFVAMLVLSFIPRSSKPQSGFVVPASAGGAVPAAVPATAAVAPPAERAADAVLLATGDGHVVWVALPATDDSKNRGFQLFQRTANTGVWWAAGGGAGGGNQNFFGKLGAPRGLAMAQEPVVFGDGGKAFELSLAAADMPLNRLPQADLLRAVAGGEDQLFALTFGQEQNLKVGDSVSEDQAEPAAPAPASLPSAASQAAPQTGPATTSAATAVASAEAAQTVAAQVSPATQTAAPASTAATVSVSARAAPPADFFNVYWYPPVARAPATGSAPAADRRSPEPGAWSVLTSLGRPVTGDPSKNPTPSSTVAMAESHGRLLVAWSDPIRPRSLFVKALDYAAQDPKWSDAVETQLEDADQIPGGSRLYAVTLDRIVYVLWTVPTEHTVALHGGWLNTNPAATAGARYKLTRSLMPMTLDTTGKGTTAANVAVAAAENSFVVVVSSDASLSAMVFDNRGVKISDNAPVVLASPRRDIQIGQNIAMMLAVLVLTLSLWQWRQKVPPMALPKGFVLAPMHLRALAFLIDLSVPYLIVFFTIGGMDGGPLGMLGNWLSLPSHPEDLAHQWDLYLFLALILVHMTAGELFFRKSMGKALVGIEVRMLDGATPTVGAVLTRNLVRIPETIVGIALVYMAISDRKQRLGDQMAKTVVVGQESPETPDDPDK